jgi:sec-independent protein translocase protein TatA
MNIGTPEIIVILILALLLYGKRLPEISRAVGKGYAEFRKNLDSVKKDLEEQTKEISSSASAQSPNPAVQEEDDKIKEADKIYSEAAQTDTAQDQTPALPATTQAGQPNHSAKKNVRNDNLAG